LIEEEAFEGWIFLDYDVDGRVRVLAREEYEAA
jgi:hypothetical protein